MGRPVHASGHTGIAVADPLAATGGHRWWRRLALVLAVVTLAALAAAWISDWRLVVVETASMEPSVPENSLAVVQPVRARAIRQGDVIRFQEPADRRNSVLHRVVQVIEQPGTLAFRTQGDANNAPDGLLVPAGDVTGRLRFHVAKAGSVASALAPPAGLLAVAGLPLAALGVIEWRRASAGRRRPMPDDQHAGPEGASTLP